MSTLAIKLEADIPVLILRDDALAAPDACLFQDPFLGALVREAEHKLRKSLGEPQST